MPTPNYLYDVTLSAPPILWTQRDDLGALYANEPPTVLRIKAPSAEAAEAKALVMIPWRLNPLFFSVRAVWASRANWRV
jgi:hypothetical protein